MNAYYWRKYFFLFLIAMLLLFIGCSENNDYEFNENNELTAAAVSNIYRACKYQNGDFCEEACCKAAEECNGQAAYKECDLETGEWKNEIFDDSGCSSMCEIIASDDSAQNRAALDVDTCDEGWKCINKYDKIYRNPDCSLGDTERCKAGCINDTCIKICNPGNFSCRNDALQICDYNGEGWNHYINCAYGCENNNCLNLTIQPSQANQTENITEPVQNVCGSECFEVAEINENPDGDDILNNEYVTVRNTCSFSCDLTGWEISDAASHKYEFTSFILGSGIEFTLYSGNGTDTESKFYWKRGQAVWNNDGDTIFLKNDKGELVLEHSYT